MALHPQTLPPVPDATAATVRAALPKGNLYVDLHAEFGTLYADQLFAALSPPEGRPVDVSPWRLALVTVRQDMEGLSDRQAAAAVRRCMDWQYALSLDWHAPGFDCTLWHDVRELCWPMTPSKASWLPSCPRAKRAAGSRRGGRNGRMRPMAWRRSAIGTV